MCILQQRRTVQSVHVRQISSIIWNIQVDEKVFGAMEGEAEGNGARPQPKKAKSASPATCSQAVSLVRAVLALETALGKQFRRKQALEHVITLWIVLL